MYSFIAGQHRHAFGFNMTDSMTASPYVFSWLKPLRWLPTQRDLPTQLDFGVDQTPTRKKAGECPARRNMQKIGRIWCLVYVCIIVIYLYTWSPIDPCFDRQMPYYGRLLVQNRSHAGSRCIYIYIIYHKGQKYLSKKSCILARRLLSISSWKRCKSTDRIFG